MNLGFVQYLNMVNNTLYWAILTYVDLIIYSLVLSRLAQLPFNLFFSWLAAIMGLVCHLLEKDEGIYLLTVHSYVEFQFIAALTSFVLGTQLNTYTLLIFGILKHLIDLASYRYRHLECSTSWHDSMREASDWRTVVKDIKHYISNWRCYQKKEIFYPNHHFSFFPSRPWGSFACSVLRFCVCDNLRMLHWPFLVMVIL